MPEDVDVKDSVEEYGESPTEDGDGNKLIVGDPEINR